MVRSAFGSASDDRVSRFRLEPAWRGSGDDDDATIVRGTLVSARLATVEVRRGGATGAATTTGCGTKRGAMMGGGRSLDERSSSRAVAFTFTLALVAEGGGGGARRFAGLTTSDPATAIVASRVTPGLSADAARKSRTR